uniref:NADH-ubiquinone oxidoreductase chain 4 n=1 Tax=Lamprigera yunnana TaxID=370605 RepID=A0A5C0PWP2_9COLE|nr:NADH dehydrogenase subunit 4 [Lamprigera yunnana]QEJ81508.1 NADH dehydrogenase subunit 4 [Lamprigera yunnana]
MMKFLFMMIFMIPLCLMKSLFLYIQLYMYLLFFMFISMFYYMSDYGLISFSFGIDYLSYMMIMLSVWICMLMMMASFNIYVIKDHYGLFNFTVLFLMICLYLTFCSMNIMVLYLFFEMSLIPVLFLILGWGYQPERLQAGLYMFMYTLLGSLPFMVSIFYMYMNYMTLSLNLLFFVDSLYIYFLMIFVFLIKIPMYMVHLWLPKAHVEAPVSGSMILAGLMLKLGGYGLMRVLKYYVYIAMKVNFTLIMLSLIGSMYISMICLRQTDIKSLIAYSSISHMGLVLSGLMTMNLWGFYGSLYMMIAHGLCSSGLFCLANLNYERLFSRSLYLNKGLMNLMPSLSLWWFLLCSSNMSAPPSLNLMGEIMLINSVVSWNFICILFLVFSLFFGACYSLFLYSYTQHGIISFSIFSFKEIKIREYLLLFLHWFPLNLIILFGDKIL